MLQQEENITSVEDTINLAKIIAKNLNPGDIITLSGDLGTGKTFLCKNIINYFFPSEINVTSPTFQLLNIYNVNDNRIKNIYHYDLYRLKNRDEIFELAIDDALRGNNITLIEWPEIIIDLLPKNIINIELSITQETRKCVINDNTNTIFR